MTPGQYGLFAVAGNAFTGGGGGGGSQINGGPYTRTYGANGGSGVSILRMYANIAAPASVSGASTSVPGDGYIYYTFTTSGTITF